MFQSSKFLNNLRCFVLGKKCWWYIENFKFRLVVCQGKGFSTPGIAYCHQQKFDILGLQPALCTISCNMCFLSVRLPFIPPSIRPCLRPSYKRLSIFRTRVKFPSECFASCNLKLLSAYTQATFSTEEP